MTFAARVATLLAVISLGVAPWPARAEGPAPIAPCPDNPRYFVFRGKPVFLITSGEHYGAVLNGDFEAVPYLDELRARGFNLTRTFSGTYHEITGSFQIRDNTLAPLPERYVGPWARSAIPGARDGGQRFDLRAWNPAYFRRLEQFVAEAGRRGIVVELSLFCPFYDDALWAVNPMNAQNNVNDLGAMPRTEVYTLEHERMVSLHEDFVRKVVTVLKPFDNVYYEICNEPYFGGVTLAWQARIAATIVRTERELGGPRHLIAQNIANGRAKVKNPNPAVSLFNFHYATPPDVVALNAGLGKALGDDETGFRGNDDRPYRTEAWDFLLAGGSAFSNLDYSFTVAHPDGTAKVSAPTPGGGGPALRSQLAILRGFLEGFEFVRMAPDPTVIAGGVPEKATARALSTPGNAYAIYINGGVRAALVLALPPGHYHAEWVDTRTGAVAKAENVDGGKVTLESPAYREDIALRVKAR